ncbi:unnamed protein product [Rhizopus stolonifer]
MPETDKLLKALKENEEFQQKIIAQQMVEAKQQADLYVLRTENNALKTKLKDHENEEKALFCKYNDLDKENTSLRSDHAKEIAFIHKKVKMLESKNQSIINDSKDAYSKLIASNEDAISTKSKLEEAVKEKEELNI